MVKEWRIDDLPGIPGREAPIFQTRFFRFPVAIRHFRPGNGEDVRALEEIAQSKGGLQWLGEERLTDRDVIEWAMQRGQRREKNFVLFAASEIVDGDRKSEEEKCNPGTVFGMIYFCFDKDEKKIIRELRSSRILPRISYGRQIFEIEYIKHPVAPRNIMKKAIMHACVAINNMKSDKEANFEERPEVKQLIRYHKNNLINKLLMLDKKNHDKKRRMQTSPIAQIHLTPAERVLTKSSVEMIIYSLIDENNTASLKLAQETGFVYVGSISGSDGAGKSGILTVHLLDWNKLDDLMKSEYGLFTKESFDPGPGKDTKDINLRNTAPADLLLPNWP